LIGVQARNTHSSSFSRGISLAPGATPATADIVIDGCIVTGIPHGSSFAFVGSSGTFTFINCLSYANACSGFDLRHGAGATHNVYNCVAAANNNGFSFESVSSTNTIRNCYAGGSTTADFTGPIDTASNNHSEDGTNGTTTAYSTSSGAYFTNITASSENFSVTASSDLIDDGFDLSGTFTTDILGTTRGATFDVGVYEYVAAGGDPEGSLIQGKLLRGGLLLGGVLTR
jgi:hypothetical protein